MINFIVAFDERDTELGVYFNDCRNQLLGVLEELAGFLNGAICEMSSYKCNSTYIDIKIPIFNSNPFIFIAYSHGNESALCSGGNEYVEKNTNAHHFKNSLFYSTACSIGKDLGHHLIAQGCLAFVGYEGEINAYKQTRRKEISMNCDNAGIIAFLSDDITIYDSFEKMKNYYTQQIDNLEDIKDMMFAMDLLKARESLVCLGDKTLKRESFFID